MGTDLPGYTTPAGRVRRCLVGAVCTLYFPAVFVGGLAAPLVLGNRLGVPPGPAMRYSLAVLLVAYLGGLAALFGR